ncbi:MAG: hypothetical protein CMJ46_04850 [Planctomyces sp.]|nr:hypothetical protein [Planctomyces sp.]
MAYETVRNIVELIRDKHRQMRDALEAPRARAKSPKVAVTLEYLQKDEQELQLMLGNAQSTGEKEVLDTWLQYIPDEELQATVAQTEFTPDMSVEDIIEEKMKFDQAMIEFLDHNIRETSIPRVEEFFKSLRDHVQSRAAQHAWATREEQAGSDLPQFEL